MAEAKVCGCGEAKTRVENDAGVVRHVCRVCEKRRRGRTFQPGFGTVGINRPGDAKPAAVAAVMALKGDISGLAEHCDRVLDMRAPDIERQERILRMLNAEILDTAAERLHDEGMFEGFGDQ